MHPMETRSFTTTPIYRSHEVVFQAIWKRSIFQGAMFFFTITGYLVYESHMIILQPKRNTSYVAVLKYKGFLTINAYQILHNLHKSVMETQLLKNQFQFQFSWNICGSYFIKSWDLRMYHCQGCNTGASKNEFMK